MEVQKYYNTILTFLMYKKNPENFGVFLCIFILMHYLCTVNQKQLNYE